MGPSDLLKSIQETLDEEEFDCSFQAAREAERKDLVLVSLGQDSLGRNHELQISCIDHPADESLFTGEQHPHVAVTFSTTFLIDLNPETIYETARFISFLNTIVDIPGFELNELDNCIRYRYVFLGLPGGLDLSLLLTLVGVHMFAVDKILPFIESIVKEEVSFEDVLALIIKQFEEFQQKIAALNDDLSTPGL